MKKEIKEAYHKMEVDQVLKHFKVDKKKGLSRGEIKTRMMQYGKNELKEKSQ